MIWAAGWLVNRSWSRALRLAAALGALAVVCLIHIDKEAGPCLPGLMAIVFLIVAARLRRELRQDGRGQTRTLMALALVLLGVRCWPA